MVVVADAAVAIRGDLTGFTKDMQSARSQAFELGGDIRKALSFGSLAAQGPDVLVAGLERAAQEADEVNAAIKRLAASGELPAAEARKYADILDEIGIEADQTAAELKQLRAADPRFDTAAIRAAGQEIDRVGTEAAGTAADLNKMKGVRADTHLEKLAQEARESSKALDGTGKSAGGLIGKLNSVRGALIGLGLFIGAQEIVSSLRRFFGDSIEAATELETATRGLDTVLGAHADTVNDFGETSADSFGLSKRAAAEYGALLGAQLKTAGFDLAAAADETVRLEQKAADLAATFGGDVGDAVTAISALLRGERDTIEKYGVSIKQVDVNARIAALGLDTSTAAAEKNATAVASLSLLYEQTTASQGQFARNADTNAGVQARAAAKLENAMARVGDVLLPIVADVTNFAADTLPKLIDALEEVGNVIGPLFGLLAEHADIVIPALAVAIGVKLVSALNGASLASKGAAAGMKAMRGAGLLLVVVLAEVASGLTEAFGEAAQNAIHGREAADAMRELRDAVGGEWAPVAAAKLHDLGIDVEDFAQLVEAAGGDAERAFQAIVESGGDMAVALGRLWADVGTIVDDTTFAEWDRQARVAMESVAGSVEDGADVVAGKFGEIPGKGADAMLEQQWRLTDAVGMLIDFMEQAITPAQEMMELQGFLNSKAVADGLASGNPLVVLKTQEMVNAALARIKQLEAGGYSAGYAMMLAIASGIRAGQGVTAYAMQQANQLIRNQWAGSEPKDPDSPLRGVMDAWGLMDVIAGGIRRNAAKPAAAMQDALASVAMSGWAGGLPTALPAGLSPALALGASTKEGRTSVTEYHLHVEGDIRVDEAEDAIDELRRLSAFGSFEP